MQLLLDTHAFLWWLLDDSELSEKARDSISNLDNHVFVSSASAWEISTKFRIGKLPDAQAVANDISNHILAEGFKELYITVDDGQRAGLLTGPHRDPFDRMLIAQSKNRNFVLISNDPIFREYDVELLW